MSTRYRISPQGPERLTDAQIGTHQDARRLIYEYHRVTSPLYRKPLYKDRRAFIVVLIIVLLAILVAEAVEKEDKTSQAPIEQRH